MRMFLTTVLTLAATAAAPASADDELRSTEIVDDGNAIGEVSDDLEDIGWNRWRCIARERGTWWSRTYVGYSHYFEQGSGEGVQGQNIARLIAERECEFKNCLTSLRLGAMSLNGTKIFGKGGPEGGATHDLSVDLSVLP